MLQIVFQRGLVGSEQVLELLDVALDDPVALGLADRRVLWDSGDGFRGVPVEKAYGLFDTRL